MNPISQELTLCLLSELINILQSGEGYLDENDELLTALVQDTFSELGFRDNQFKDIWSGEIQLV